MIITVKISSLCHLLNISKDAVSNDRLKRFQSDSKQNEKSSEDFYIGDWVKFDKYVVQICGFKYSALTRKGRKFQFQYFSSRVSYEKDVLAVGNVFQVTDTNEITLINDDTLVFSMSKDKKKICNPYLLNGRFYIKDSVET